jgi:hypothetical protein
MKQLNLFIATFVLGSLSLLPAASKAEDLDDLEVTMEVVDNIEGIMDVVIEMPGPEAADGTVTEGGETARSADEEPAEESAQDQRFGRQDDEFVTDEDFTEQDENFDQEGDFEESEQIDDDEYDIPMPEEDDMEEDPMEEEVV